MSEPKPSPTIDDVAARARVSAATVDRVIHKRGKPRSTTIERVMAAIEELDYRPNRAAIQLVRGRAWRIGFVVPAYRVAFLTQLIASVERLRETFSDHGADVETCRIESGNAAEFSTKFKQFAESKDACVVLAPEDPATIHVVRELEMQGKPIATLISDLVSSERTLFAGPDNFNMGAVAAQALWPLLRKSNGKVLIKTIAKTQEDHSARYAGFIDALKRSGIDESRIRSIRVNNKHNVEKMSIQLSDVANGEPVDALYITGGSTKMMTLAVRQTLGPETAIVATDLTKFSRAMLAEGTIDYVVSSNSSGSAQSAVLGLIKKLNEPHWVAKPRSVPIQLFTRFNLPEL